MNSEGPTDEEEGNMEKVAGPRIGKWLLSHLAREMRHWKGQASICLLMAGIPKRIVESLERFHLKRKKLREREGTASLNYTCFWNSNSNEGRGKKTKVKKKGREEKVNDGESLKNKRYHPSLKRGGEGGPTAMAMDHPWCQPAYLPAYCLTIAIRGIHRQHAAFL